MDIVLVERAVSDVEGDVDFFAIDPDQDHHPAPGREHRRLVALSSAGRLSARDLRAEQDHRPVGDSCGVG